MAFIVEDGTIVAGANAYNTVSAFRAYWTDRGVTFAQLDPEIEGAIVVVTQYTDGEFGECYKGNITDVTQDLCWPRTGATDGKKRTIGPNDMPIELLNAVNEYGKRQLENPEGIQPDVGDTGEVISQRDEIEAAVETETKYNPGSGGYFGRRRYPLGDNYLKGLLFCLPGGISTRLGCT